MPNFQAKNKTKVSELKNLLPKMKENQVKESHSQLMKIQVDQ